MSNIDTILLMALGVIVQLAFMILLAPLVVGILRWLEAKMQFRYGPSIFQPYWDLLERRRDRPTLPDQKTVSWVYGAAPYVVFGCCALLALAVPPSFPWLVPWLVPMDLVTVVYLLALARFAITLAAMDTGTSFAALGSSREMFLNVLGEPALMLVVIVLATVYRTTSLSSILSPNSLPWLANVFIAIALVLTLLALASAALVETGRMPIDNPSTHLELTMIQKAMHLEYSGLRLAMLEWAEAIKLMFFLALISDIILSPQLSTINLVFHIFHLPDVVITGAPGIPIGALFFLVKIIMGIALLILLAWFEMTRAKVRLGRIGAFMALTLAFGTAALAVAGVATVLGGK